MGEILKARNAERDSVFSGVMRLVMYIALVALVLGIPTLVLSILGMLGPPELGVGNYIMAVMFSIIMSAFVLFSTLPPEMFDMDLALDDRRGVRRAGTISLTLWGGVIATGFPHIEGLGVLGLLAKLIWDESVAGCCTCGARKKQHEAAGEATGFHDEQGRRVHNPTDAGCGARFRPRFTDIFCLCYYGIVYLHEGARSVFIGLCHAAAQGPSVTANTSTSNDANWATAIDASFMYNRSTLGVTNATSITCGGDIDSFK